jgi:hypothetical protein
MFVLGCLYKVHLQVQPEYIMSFALDFCNYFLNAKGLEFVKVFKLSKYSRTQIERCYRPCGGEEKEQAKPGSLMASFEAASGSCLIYRSRIPMFVIYVEFYNDSEFTRNRILDGVIGAIMDRYGEHIETIALTKCEEKLCDYTPRFNRKINDLIYIAGSDADIKIDYKKMLKEGLIQENTVFTDDYVFVKGYEYKYVPPGKRGDLEKRYGSSLYNSLTLLKHKLLQLAEKLEEKREGAFAVGGD